jgi:phosphoribosylglycinamide formyltransferase-1
MIKNIAIFASGSGTNAENIINYFANINDVNVSLILSNNPNAYVLQRAKNHNIPYIVFSRKELVETTIVLDALKDNNITFIVLAGFLLLMPLNIINAYHNRIINIHPALLPKYGGKGMYGDRVHQAVIENKEEYSGITIHFINEKYDEGEIIFQSFCKIDKNDTPITLAKKIHELEYLHYPRVINEVINKI